MTTRLELSRAKSASKNFPVPKGLDYFPFQKVGIEYSLLADNTLFGDEPGLGKTVQSIGFMNARRIKSALVIAPATLTKNWKKEIEKWSVAKLKVEIYRPGLLQSGAEFDVLVMSYAYASADRAVKDVLENFKYELAVVDECHYLKNPKAKRTKFVLARNGLLKRAKYRHAITGTLIVNRPIEIYPVVKSIAPEAIDNMDYFAFGIRYCAGWKSQWGWDFSGASNLKDLGKRLRSSIMVRRNKKDVLEDLPEKLPPNLVYLDESKDAKALVKRMKTFSPDAAIKGGVSAEFTELSEMRRELGVAKAPACADYIRTQLESGHEKIIVFAHHKEVFTVLEKELADFNPAKIVGDTPTAKRQAQVDKFQNDKTCRVFLGSGAAREGITLTASSYVVFVEFSFVPGENEQAADRAHRIGQRECVQTDYLVHENSLDEHILKIILKKEKAIKEVYE